MTYLEPGVRTTEHPAVGKTFRVLHFDGGSGPLVRMRGPQGSRRPYSVGECVSVTPWGSNRIRWIRLRHHDGTEKSYAPADLQELA